MPEFRSGVPIETADPVVEVTVTPASPLAAGRHQFQLVVVDDSGNASTPSVVEVIVRDAQKPTAVLDAPREVKSGKSSQLKTLVRYPARQNRKLSLDVADVTAAGNSLKRTSYIGVTAVLLNVPIAGLVLFSGREFLGAGPMAGILD